MEDEDIHFPILTEVVITPEHHIIDTDNITEKKYLEMAEDFKNIMKEKDNDLKRCKQMNENYKYVFYKIYGNLVMIEDILTQVDFGSNILFAVMRHTLEYSIHQLQKLIDIGIEEEE